MAYSTGMMNKRVTIARRHEEENRPFGGSTTVTQYEILGTFWAAEDFNRGVKSLREGAYDAYETVMFRMRYNADIDRWCLIQYQGKWYQIQSFNASHQDNTIQITAIEMANQQVVIYTPPPPVVHELEVWGDEACTTRPSGSPDAIYVQFNVDVSFLQIYENEDHIISITLIKTPPTTRVRFDNSYNTELDNTDGIRQGTVLRLSRNVQIHINLDPESDFSFGHEIN